jgi:hypothetical protein
MLMTLLNPSGERIDAVLLATGDQKIGIVVRGSNDTAELRRIKDQWMSDNGEVVEIESLISLAATNLERPRTMKAGS